MADEPRHGPIVHQSYAIEGYPGREGAGGGDGFRGDRLAHLAPVAACLNTARENHYATPPGEAPVGDMPDIDTIRATAERLRPFVHRTPLLSSRYIGERVGGDVWLKCENFQKTGSFKARGALNRVLSLTESEKAGGLITFSAGNHAAAVAWAGRSAGCAVTVVMPAAAPQAKVDAVRGYGAEVILEPDRARLFPLMNEIRDARGLTFIPPFDHIQVVEGAATVMLEALEDLPDPDVVVVPIAGAGLLAGTVATLAALRPAARVVGVEIEGWPGLAAAIEAGKPVAVPKPAQTRMDGLTAPFVGEVPFAIVKDRIDSLVAVSEDEALEAMQVLLTRAKLLAEGAGAAATAALLAGKVRVAPGARVVAMVSGGNVDVRL